MSKEPILRVAVNAPLPRLFDYLPPAGGGEPKPGCRLTVPFGRRRETAMLVELSRESALPRDRLRRVFEVLDREPLLSDHELWLIRFTSDYYHHPIGEVVSAALPAILRHGRPLDPVVHRLSLTGEGAAADPDAFARAPRQAELLETLRGSDSLAFAELDELLPGWRRVRKGLVDKGLVTIVESVDNAFAGADAGAAVAGPPLNPDQAAALETIRAPTGFRVSLIDGVTGSGKTEIYLHLIRDTIEAGRQVLILVPEIGLTPQLLARIRERLGVEPALLHSALTDSARLAAWRAARNGSAPLVLGTRSAVFAPLSAAGLIVVDEEHDSSLKQQEGLRYSARDLAIARAKALEIPVVLGSATPSLETLKRCRDGAYGHLRLPSRAGSAAPPLIRLVDLSSRPSAGGLSDTVVKAIRGKLAEGGQVLVFLNRRGFAPTLICTACGQIAECSRCDSRMTVHAAEALLKCHHCGASRPLDDRCLSCGGETRALGHGTERLEESLRRHFPDDEIARIDSDSVRLKGTMDRALAQATAGTLKILVGTQMLSKGHHFPNLTLVVVINADQGLFSSDFRGSERLAQTLIQVAGRAGREKRQGEVIIQTAFPEHPFWRELISGGYERLARSALDEREAAAWPPFSRLVLIRASAHKRDEGARFLDTVRDLAEAANNGEVRILGPVSAPMERRAGRYRAQLLLQSRSRQALHQLLDDVISGIEGKRIARRVRWSIDVDPIELF